MAVMHVRHVGVRVRQRRVDVGMRVRLFARHAVVVLVPVMLVVNVHVTFRASSRIEERTLMFLVGFEVTHGSGD